ncbi:MAG: hypothetical protein GY715_06965 [Planctomycetes bacterium]|nr:hypothetical protein [Planctomycetota bacterium]
MALIKRERADELTQRAIVLDLSDLRREGEHIIAAAHREAERVRETARDQSEELVASADDRGYAQGLERGLGEGREQGRREGSEESKVEYAERLATLHEQWTSALGSWDLQREAMFLAAHEEVLGFAMALARKIVLRLPDVDPTVVQDQVTEAMTRLLRPSAVTVTINAADRALVDDVLPGLQQRITTCRHAYIEEDETVRRGGCIVRTEHGAIDATLDRQLDRIADALLAGEAPGPMANEDPAHEPREEESPDPPAGEPAT